MRIRLALAAVAALAAPLLAVEPAQAKLDFTRCKSDASFDCASLPVPLDPSGKVPGTIKLRVERLRSSRSAKGLVIALGGGPGQGVTPVAGSLADVLRPALKGRQLVVFDQRGTGASGALDCRSLQKAPDDVSRARAAALAAGCAKRLGARRAFYTTTESVADMDGVRRAMRAQKVTVVGISYGTYVAQRYAHRYPTRTERLVLDSVVPQDGGDPFQLSAFGAVPRVLTGLCARRACRRVTADPVGDVAALVARLSSAPVRGSVFDARGHARAATLRTATDLFAIYASGDLNDAARAAFPAAVRSALNGDPAALLRLQHSSREPPSGVRDLSAALYAATSCEETPLPWGPPTAPVSRRPRQLTAALDAIPDSAFYPFDRSVGPDANAVSLCERWPVTSAARPPSPATLNVPALLIGGRADTRTPIEDARRAAALIPGAQLVTVPGTGHSVLTSDVTSCTTKALERFFGGAKVGDPCRGRSNLEFDVAPPAPTSLSQVHTIASMPSRAGRTLQSVFDAIRDLTLDGGIREQAGDMDTISAGGLRGGSYRFSDVGGLYQVAKLHRLIYVPGVILNGRLVGLLDQFHGELRVSGPSAEAGTIRFEGKHVTARLGGHTYKMRNVSSFAARSAMLARARAHTTRVRPGQARVRFR